MKYVVFSTLCVGVFFGTIFLLYQNSQSVRDFISPIVEDSRPRPLLAYTYENLQKRKYQGSKVALGKTLADEQKFMSRIFYFTVEGKKVSGLINIPKTEGPHPVIVMIRGFVDPSVYVTGEGTQHAGQVFAENGFVTVSPDFLGYGESDLPVADGLQDRFMTYVTVLELIASLKNIPNVNLDFAKIGIWGHSNGGQIALSVLEISQGSYPTVLWAPVSKPFPESVLYYARELDKKDAAALKNLIAGFESLYNPQKYSLTSYAGWIRAPIQLHQGEKDEEVPKEWSDGLYEKLKSLNLAVEYYTYSAQDHNFDNKADWDTATQRSLEFYRRSMGL